MNTCVHQGLADFLTQPEYSDADLLALRSQLAAHTPTHDGLEYFLSTRIQILRRQASHVQDLNGKVALHNQADALCDVLALLFGTKKSKQPERHAVRV